MAFPASVPVEVLPRTELVKVVLPGLSLKLSDA
jgi:hypothetical protein